MKTLLATIASTLLFSTSIFAMGGDKPGPNGGYITMPGTYHVELLDKGNTMQVYLLDISMKNPTVKDSTVSLKYIGEETKEVACKAKKKHFVCEKPNKNLGKFTKIELESVRNKVKGTTASYKLPLRFE